MCVSLSSPGMMVLDGAEDAFLAVLQTRRVDSGASIPSDQAVPARIRLRIRTPTAEQSLPARLVEGEPAGRHPQGRTESRQGRLVQR